MLGEGRSTHLIGTCKALYFAYGLSAILQLFSSTVILGIFVLIMAHILTAFNRGLARKTDFESHLHWMTRTLKLGSTVFFPLALAFALWYVWKYTGIQSALKALDSDDMDVVMGGIHDYISGNVDRVSRITTLSMLPAVFWWCRRCLFGYLRVKEGDPIDYPDSWF